MDFKGPKTNSEGSGQKEGGDLDAEFLYSVAAQTPHDQVSPDRTID